MKDTVKNRMAILNEARYMPSSPLTPYHVRWKGKFYCSNDTAELVERVLKDSKKRK